MAHPYHYAIDLFARGALAEHTGFIWPPLILLCTLRLAQGSFWGLPGLTLTYAGLVLSHPMTAAIFSPVILGYALISAPGRRWASLVATLGGLRLGLGVTGLYLVPALTLQDHVFIERLWSWSTPEQFFLFSGSVPENYRPFLLAISGVALTSLGAVRFVLPRGPLRAGRELAPRGGVLAAGRGG